MSHSTTDADNLAQVVETARAALDQASQRADRLKATANNQAALGGTWFAAAQATAALTLSGHAAQGWIIGLVVGAISQAAALCVLLAATTRVSKIHGRQEIGSNTLAALAMKASDPAPQFANELILLYRNFLYEAHAANDDRAVALAGREDDDGKLIRDSKWWSSAACWWPPVLLLGLGEIVIALLSRVA